MNLRPEPTHLRERCDWLLNVRVYLGELLLDPGLMKSPTYLIRIELQELDTMMAMAARRCWDFGTPLFDGKPERYLMSIAQARWIFSDGGHQRVLHLLSARRRLRTAMKRLSQAIAQLTD